MILSEVLGIYWWVMLPLLIIGAVSLVTLILQLFSSFGYRTSGIRETGPVSADSEDFLVAIARLVDRSVEQGGDIQLLNNGDAFLKTFFQDIKSAQHTINFTNYIWRNGEMSRQIVEALLERAQAGVEVRLLLDAQGSRKASVEELEALISAGAYVQWFRPARLGKMTRYHKRSHRRAIIIDGKVAYTGGIAIRDDWLGNANSTHQWRDMMFRMTGQMASSLQGSFTDLWFAAEGEVFTGERFYPHISEESPSRNVRFIHLASSPADDTQPLDKFIWLTFASAQKRLYIESPFLILYHHIRDVLIDRAKAGVDVRILLPQHLDVRYVRSASRSHYQDLLKAGVKIYEYKKAMLHTKAIVVDGVWSVIGSANLDIRSAKYNEETVMGIWDHKFGDDMEKAFEKDLQYGVEITLEEWMKRPLGQKVLERMYYTFEEQF